MSKASVGIISDTHGLVRPEAIDALGGSDLILHAGDIGSPDVLQELSKIGPVYAVKGNNDKGEWTSELPLNDVIEVEQVFFYLIHDLKEIDLDPAAAGFQVVVSGHSHKPQREEKKGVLYLNPGSAGPRRFKLPICVARVQVSNRNIQSEIVELLV